MHKLGIARYRLNAMSPLRTIGALLPALAAAAAVAGCGSSQPAPVKLTSTSSCSEYLHAAKSIQATKNVQLNGKAIHVTEADNLWSMCNSELNGLQKDPAVSSMTSEVQTDCPQWLVMSNAQQLAFAQAVVGRVNLTLRVRGETSACANEPQSLAVTDSAADGLLQIAAAYPGPVNVDFAKVPTTTSPDDPDRCNERTANASGDSNAQWIADGLADCVAMGF
jgi:hypothetical protein